MTGWCRLRWRSGKSTERNFRIPRKACLTKTGARWFQMKGQPALLDPYFDRRMATVQLSNQSDGHILIRWRRSYFPFGTRKYNAPSLRMDNAVWPVSPLTPRVATDHLLLNLFLLTTNTTVAIDPGENYTKSFAVEKPLHEGISLIL